MDRLQGRALLPGPGVMSRDAWPGLRGTPPPLSRADPLGRQARSRGALLPAALCWDGAQTSSRVCEGRQLHAGELGSDRALHPPSEAGFKQKQLWRRLLEASPALASLWVESHRHRELCQSPAVSPLPQVPDAREKGVTFERQELSESIDQLEGRHSASPDICACHF